MPSCPGGFSGRALDSKIEHAFRLQVNVMKYWQISSQKPEAPAEGGTKCRVDLAWMRIRLYAQVDCENSDSRYRWESSKGETQMDLKKILIERFEKKGVESVLIPGLLKNILAL